MTAGSPETFAFAWEDIVGSHVVDSHLAAAAAAAVAAAAEAHTGCIGRSHRPAVASCTVGPWMGSTQRERNHRKSIYRRGIVGESGV